MKENRRISYSYLQIMVLFKVFFAVLILFCFYSISFAESIGVEFIKKLKTGGAPKSIVITPDGKYAYINNLEGCSVWKYDVSEKEVVKKIQFYKTPAIGYNYTTKEEIPSFAEKPVESAFTNNGELLWISLHNAEEVVIYNTKESDFQGENSRKARIHNIVNGTQKDIKMQAIKVGKTPKIVKASPDGKWIYVANWHSNDVTVIDVAKKRPVRNIPVVRIPRGIAFSSDSKYAYIANMGSLYATVIDVENDHKKTENLKIGLNPRDIYLSHDDRFIFTTHNMEKTFNKTEIESRKTVSVLQIGERPRTFVLSNCGKYAFILAYDDNTMSIVNIDKMKVLQTIETGSRPIGAAITPDGKEIWVTNYFEGTVSIYTIDLID